MTWKKRIMSIALCLCALLCAASVRADAADTHTNHPICGTTCDHKDGTHITDTPNWQPWSGGDITYTNNVAYIYLSDDVILQRNNDTWGYILPLEVGNNQTLYLCLNGHSLSNRGSYTISVSGTLVLCDCEPDDTKGTITHTKNTDGSFTGSEGIYVSSGATFTMYGGTISENERGVLVSGGTFTMYGGEISHNTCTTSSAEGGGGVWVKDYKSWSSGQTTLGNFAMYGGTICNNEIQSVSYGGGGVCMIGDGSFYMENGTITGNKCNNSGGGLDIRCETITIKGNSTISGNTCGGEGGGIFAVSSGESSITNCTISGNSATGTNSLGGGLTFQNSTFTLKECAITDNKTAGQGGAICLMTSDANLTLSGGLNFSGNQDNCPADESGNLTTGTVNDVYLNTSSACLRLASDFSKTSAVPIVVTTSYEPDAYGYKKIAEDNRATPNATDFTYGNNSNIGIIAKTKADGTTVELLACKHNYSTKKDATNHWQECSICGDKKDVAKHTYSTDWQTNSTKHWHKCECGQRSGEAKHSYSSDWKTGDGKHWHECECGQKSEEAAHSYSTAWDRDNTSHFHKCSACGDKTDIAICVYTARVTSGHQKSDATCTAKAVYWKSCVCDRESTETFEYGETNPNNHTGQLGDWQTNTDEHWKVYSCCQAQSDKAAHTWDEGKVTTPATCTTVGERTYTCGTCNAKKTERIDATGHTYNQTKVEDKYLVSAATCTAKAVYYKSCVCGARGTDTFEFGEKLAHTYDKEVATETYLKSAATCTDRAVYYKSCVCARAGTETFEYGEKNPNNHTGQLGDWQTNTDEHWKVYSCCQAQSDKAAHTWDEGEVTTPATCTTDGEKTYTCTVCSATKTKTIPATGHTPDAAVRENIVAATCTTAGSYDEVVYCTACRNEVSRTQKTIDKLAHDYDTTKWVKADENQHGHKCKNCDAITDLTAHVPGAAATETTPQLCTKCGYVIAPATHPEHTWVFVAETPATCNAAGEREHYKCTCGRTSFKNGDAYKINEDASVLTIEKNSANHTGAPGSEWLSDSANHWQEYTCCHARANEAAHSGGAATCTAQAVCQVCGKAYGPLAAHAWQPATCTAPKTCTACHVTDGAALGHDWGAWEVTTPATKDAPGVETRTCAHNSAHTETRSIPKLSTAVYTVSEDTKIAQIEAKVDGLDKILELNENKALVNDGKSVGVSLTVKNTASSGVSEKIKEKLAGSNMVGLRLELTVEKTVTANGVVESKQTIPDAGVLLKTTITLPAELQGKSGYVVYRMHDENVHVLTETANENGEFISVSADKTQITICARLYSEYVIAYQTGGSSGGGYHPVNPTPVKATSANTGDAGVLLYGVTAALSLTGTAWLGAKSRKH